MKKDNKVSIILSLTSKVIYVLILILLTISCRINTQDNPEIIYLNNDSTNYVKISYYENGNFKDSSFYLNGELSGIRVSYNSEKKLITKREYEKGIQIGVEECYDENGKIYSKSYIKNGERDGDTYYYNENGNINSYFFYTNGNSFFYRKYDINNKIISTEGRIFTFLAIASDTFNVGDEIYFNAIFANPPYSKSWLYLFEAESKDNKFKAFEVEIQFPNKAICSSTAKKNRKNSG
jgi:hypothetical protein